MTVLHVVAPTLAVTLTWACVIAVLAGCGFATRAGLSRLVGAGAGAPATADPWIGLAALLAYLVVWNLFLPINGLTWIAPLALGLGGVSVMVRRLGGSGLGRRRGVAVLAAVALGALWLANQALAAAGDYDLGLYHLNVVAYAEKYAALPGLANLHVRLGSSDAHLLLVALLDHGLWSMAGPHLADGLLASMLFLDVGLRFVRRPAFPSAATFTSRAALLLAGATIVVVGIRPTHRLASPNLDFAAFVLVAVGMLYLAEAVEFRFRTPSVLAATGSLAAASATRPLYCLATVCAIGVTWFGTTRRHHARRASFLRAGALACTLPALLGVAAAARQAVLSGYPFFPITFAALSANWRVPAAIVHRMSRGDYAWARESDVPPSIVFASWHWLSGWWWARERDLDVVGPLALLACLLPSLATPTAPGLARSRRTAAMLAVFIPSVATLVVWFLLAPDPRFAFAPIWLAPIAVAAWALPSRAERAPLVLLLGGAAGAAAFAALGSDHIVWLVPDALALSVVAAVAIRAFRPRPLAGLIPPAILIATALGAVSIVIGRGALEPVVARGHGPLDTPAVPVPTLRRVTTSWGLELWQPVDSDQCWRALLCVPHAPAVFLHLRGSTIADGFSSEL